MKVSILIPCYNAERWIAAAIQSALDQRDVEKEVIVVDDGSTDDSSSIIRSFGDAIRAEFGPNRGGNVARNRLLALATGEWLQYLDADDYLMADKVAGQARHLVSHPDCDVLFGPAYLEHHEADGVTRSLLPIPEPHDPWVLLARWYLPQTGAPLWRRQALVDIGGWNEQQPVCQEHELYLRLLMAGKRFAYCPHAGAVYRQWGEHTVCKRNKPETWRRRLEIEDRAEAHLRATGGLDRARLWAINMARFETARSMWAVDSVGASAVAARVRSSMPDFVPCGDAAPRAYARVYGTFGFAFAERMAGWKRRLSSRAGSA